MAAYEKEREISIHSLYAEGDVLGQQRAVRQLDISIHSLYAEGDARRRPGGTHGATFQSTPSTQRETDVKSSDGSTKTISIHSLYAEGDRAARHLRLRHKHFNPLPLRRGRLASGGSLSRNFTFQSTPSTQRETGFGVKSEIVWDISIHSLYAEGDDYPAGWKVVDVEFQSTPSTQRETPCRQEHRATAEDFNPLPLRRGRPKRRGARMFPRHFNPLPLRRGRRRVPAKHTGPPDFNPLPLRRGRLLSGSSSPWSMVFQSTPSTQRETLHPTQKPTELLEFQSTPSTQRETGQRVPDPVDQEHFNPLPLRRGRLAGGLLVHERKDISIHSLYAEGDVSAFALPSSLTSFQSTPSTQRETGSG